MPTESDTPAADHSEQVEHLRKEVEALVTEARIEADRAESWARFFRGLNVVLGLPAAILAAVSGATGLLSADGRIPAAFMALAVAAFSAVVTFLRPNERADQNWRRKNAFAVLEADARLVLARQGYEGVEALYGALRQLLQQRVEAMDIDTDNSTDQSPRSTSIDLRE